MGAATIFFGTSFVAFVVAALSPTGPAQAALWIGASVSAALFLLFGFYSLVQYLRNARSAQPTVSAEKGGVGSNAEHDALAQRMSDSPGGVQLRDNYGTIAPPGRQNERGQSPVTRSSEYIDGVGVLSPNVECVGTDPLLAPLLSLFPAIEFQRLVSVSTTGYVSSTSATHEAESRKGHYLRAAFQNRPTPGVVTADAKRVQARLRFNTEQSEQYELKQGRWSETREIASGATLEEVTLMDFPADGRFIQNLDFVVKPQDSEVCYVWGPQGMYKKFPLKPGRHTVDVYLTGENTKRNFRFLLDNPAGVAKPTLSLMR